MSRVEWDDAAPVVAILPWGDVIEDYLGAIDVSFEAFVSEMTGGWLFGYVEALRRSGARSVLICVSTTVTEPTRFHHTPTGATLWALPPTRSHSALRRRMRDPMGWTLEDMFGPGGRLKRQAQQAVRDVAPYLATPIRPLVEVLRREGCTALLCQEYEYPRFDVCVAIGRWLKIPVFGTFQGGDWQASRIERLVRPHTLQACNGLIVAPQTEVDRVRARYGLSDEKVARIFNPLRVEEWVLPPKREARDTLRLPATARVVAWHGRVDLHRKGLDVLLDAWAEVVRAHPSHDLRLLLIGTGADAERLRRRLASPSVSGVTWLDEYVLDRDRLRGYLAAADLYAFPSRHEGFPVALMEAMAAGLPVVAADAPGVPDILGANGGPAGTERLGVMVPRGDASALASALGHLIDDPALAERLGRRARQAAAKTFAFEAVGRRLRAFLSGPADARLRGSGPQAPS